MTATKQLFLWYGENDFAIQEKVNQWIAAFEKKHQSINIFTFDWKDTAGRSGLALGLKNALQVESLFGSTKLIVLRDFLSTGAKLNAEVKEILEKALPNISAHFYIIFAQGDNIDKTNTVYRQLVKGQKEGRVELEEFKRPVGRELVKWILERGNKYSAKFSSEAVDLMAAMVGNDLWQMEQEIQKLANFKKSEKITKEDVNLLVRGQYNDDIFQLMDAISDKNKKKTLKLFRDQLDSGANEMYILSMLIRQFRIFLQVKELLQEQPLSPEAIAKELGIHPFVIKKTLYYFKHFSLEELRRIYLQLLDIDIKMKTRSWKFELLFDRLVAQLA